MRAEVSEVRRRGPFALVRSFASNTAKLLAAVAFCTSLLTAGLMAMSAGFFTLVSSAIEAVADLKTVRRQHVTEIDQLRLGQAEEVARINATHADEVSDLRRQIDAADRRVASQADELVRLRGETMVPMPDGQSRPLREMVSETTERVSTVATRSAARNIATMPGEGIPLLGIAVVVAATGLEIKDACEISTAMYELDRAMNPDSARQNDVCGMDVPTAQEIWEKIVSSPSDVWDEMVATYEDLPTLALAWDWMQNILVATTEQIWALILWVWSLIPTMQWPDWLSLPEGPNWEWPSWTGLGTDPEEVP